MTTTDHSIQCFQQTSINMTVTLVMFPENDSLCTTMKTKEQVPLKLNFLLKIFLDPDGNFYPITSEMKLTREMRLTTLKKPFSQSGQKGRKK